MLSNDTVAVIVRSRVENVSQKAGIGQKRTLARTHRQRAIPVASCSAACSAPRSAKYRPPGLAMKRLAEDGSIKEQAPSKAATETAARSNRVRLPFCILPGLFF